MGSRIGTGKEEILSNFPKTKVVSTESRRFSKRTSIMIVVFVCLKSCLEVKMVRLAMDDNLYLTVKRQHLAAIHLVCVLVTLIAHRVLHNGKRNNALTPDKTYYIDDNGLRSTQHMSIEEQVARFLHIVDNDFRNRFVSFFYRRSGSSNKLTFSQRAIDQIHVCVKVSNKDAPKYRGRKGYPTINVLVAYTFDLKFTYVLSGWEGTMFDSRVLKDALSREDKLYTPKGKFYLVDGGLPLRNTLIEPYRGVRVLKSCTLKFKRITISHNPSTTEPFYSCETQSQIFLACILHNLFLFEVNRDQELEDEVIRNMINVTQDEDQHVPRAMDNRRKQIIECIANEIIETTRKSSEKNLVSPPSPTPPQSLAPPHSRSAIDAHQALVLKLTISKKRAKYGNKIDSTFTPQVYTNMVEQLSKAFEMDLTKDHLKNRLKTIKEHFAKWHDVFKGVLLSGFSWDLITNVLGAEDDVLKRLIKLGLSSSLRGLWPPVTTHRASEDLEDDRKRKLPDPRDVERCTAVNGGQRQMTLNGGRRRMMVNGEYTIFSKQHFSISTYSSQIS
ncbi:hypothetical protein OSB04_001533 [Centaurea solstitialis]|uniref:Transposase n=1 Tax=Centaurea solstitialis TaxID=347529 RepID=A0AA38WLU4_9ASTR|nr:hypothetical protein OSB04_001533 [Centaurea solstitialis]